MLDEPSVDISPIANQRIFLAIEEIKKKEKITVLPEKMCQYRSHRQDRNHFLEDGCVTFSTISAELERKRCVSRFLGH